MEESMKKLSIIFLLIACMASFALAVDVDTSAQADTNNRGMSGFTFLKLPATARQAALGEAIYSNDISASAMFGNISEIADIEGTSMYYTNIMLYDNLFQVSNFALTTKISERMALGVMAQYLSTDPIEITTLDDPDGTDIEYNYHDMALGVGMGYRVTRRFSIGMKAKYVEEKIYNTSATAFLFDVSTLYRLQYSNIKIAAILENYGTDTKFSGNDLWRQVDTTTGSGIPDQTDPKLPVELNTKEFGAPVKIVVGVSGDFLGSNSAFLNDMDDHVGTLYASMYKTNDQKESFHLGMEYQFIGLEGFQFALRGGYIMYQEEDWENRFSAGAGLVAHMSDTYALVIDYAYKTHEDLDESHVFSVGFNF
jgi:hypothetical protein